MKISLSFYALSFNVKRHTSDVQDTDKLTGTYSNAMDAIKYFLDHMESFEKGKSTLDDVSRLCFREKLYEDKGNFYGLLRSGED